MDAMPAIPIIEGLQIHKAQGLLFVSFSYHPETVERIKNVMGRRWHPAEKCWSIPHTERAVAHLRSLFSQNPLTSFPRAAPTGRSGARGSRPTPDEKLFLEPVQEEIRLRGYSRHTGKSYCHHLLRCRRHVQREPAEVGEIEIRQYLLHLIEEGVSRSYLNQAISAIKFLYNRVLRTPLEVDGLPRPRRERVLPVVLGRGEVLSIFAAIDNPKHRALLMVAYSSGLRVSEVARLKVEDIDIERMMVRVHRAKGRKDRYTPLSRVALETLEAYQQGCRPQHWLFPGAREGRHLTTRSIQKVMERARKNAGLRKKVTMHTLRHSYATHLLEDGTDLRYVQELLGHRRPETTMIYTHVTRKDIRRIRSPLDNAGSPRVVAHPGFPQIRTCAH